MCRLWVQFPISRSSPPQKRMKQNFKIFFWLHQGLSSRPLPELHLQPHFLFRDSRLDLKVCSSCLSPLEPETTVSVSTRCPYFGVSAWIWGFTLTWVQSRELGDYVLGREELASGCPPPRGCARAPPVLGHLEVWPGSSSSIQGRDPSSGDSRPASCAFSFPSLGGKEAAYLAMCWEL